jgi:hypothetical protein
MILDIVLTTDRQVINLPRDRLTAASISTGVHGDERMAVTYRSRLNQSFARYAALSANANMELAVGAVPVWAGRVEDIGLNTGDLSLTAFGRWRALSDIPFTGLFSSTRSDQWASLDETQATDNRPARFYFDTSHDNLIIAPQKNALMESVVLGRLGFVTPDQSTRALATAVFDFEYSAAANWQVGLQTFTAPSVGGWTFGSNAWFVSIAAGGVVTGNINIALTGSPNAAAFFMRYNAAAAAYGGETRDFYLKITNLRITTVSGGVVTGDQIALGLLSSITAVNPDAISSATGFIQNPGVDLRDAIYEDAQIGPILDTIAGYGTSTGQRLEVGVGPDGQLYLRPRGVAGRTWIVDLADIQITPTLNQLANSVYTVYKNTSGRTVRSNINTNTASTVRYGLTRRSAVTSDTTSGAEANQVRDTALNDTATPIPQANVTVRRLRTPSGALVPGWLCRAGDTLVVRDLPPAVSDDIDRIRSFRLVGTDYNLLTQALQVVPESPQPLLEFMLARAAIGVRS